MIRIYDAIGRIKEEIDPRSEHYLHISYVREYGFGWEVHDPILETPRSNLNEEWDEYGSLNANPRASGR